MTTEVLPSAPLVFHVELTAEQRRQIHAQTGHAISALPFESRADCIRVPFGGLRYSVPRGVFVPTASTERLLAAGIAAALTFRNPVLVDVGTGCGVVALAAARELPHAVVYATDISDVALHAARGNRTRLGVRNVRFLRGSLLSTLPRRLRGGVHVIVGNVPYVPPSYTDALAGFFPANSAIGVGSDGLGLVRDLATAARDFLVPGGSLVLQLASFQWSGFAEELIALGYSAPTLRRPVGEGPVVGTATHGG